jgi:biopolymer transport protein ExbB
MGYPRARGVTTLWLRVCLVIIMAPAASTRASDPFVPTDQMAANDGIRSESIRIGGGVTALGDMAEIVTDRAQRLVSWMLEWYQRTQPPERATWGGLAACAILGIAVLLERLGRLRRHRIVPRAFTSRFLDRLHEGRLDCGQALDHCELNPSPAARVALAAVRRWGRPSAELERAVTLAHRVETERLRRNVGTLRRVAALAPLIGLLGTLLAVSRTLEAIPPAYIAPDTNLVSPAVPSPALPIVAVAWGPALAAALAPLSTGILIAILALVAYDGVLVRVEKLAGSLDRLGAETIEAIAMSAPMPVSPIALGSSPAPPRLTDPGPDPEAGSPALPARTPHQRIFRRDDEIESVGRAAEPEIGF